MADRPNRIDDALRALAEEQSPTTNQREKALLNLRAEIRAEATRPAPRRKAILASAAAGVALLVGFLVVLQLRAPSVAAAAMEEVASLAEIVDPVTAPDGSFVFTVSSSVALAEIPRDGLVGQDDERDSLVYLYETERRSWVGDDGTVHLEITVLEPSFFRPEDELLYFSAGLDVQDQVGETITSTTSVTGPSNWPRDREELDQAIRAEMATNRGLPETVEYLDVALDIVRESFADPELRAQALRLIGALDGLELSDTDGSRSDFRIDYAVDGRDVRSSFTLSDDGYLLAEEDRNLSHDAERGIPANTPTFSAVYSAPAVVDTLPKP